MQNKYSLLVLILYFAFASSQGFCSSNFKEKANLPIKSGDAAPQRYHNPSTPIWDEI